MALLLGFDVGSSYVKACILDAETGTVFSKSSSPRTEMEIISRHAGWAEQHPETWWETLKDAARKLKGSFNFNPSEVKAIGISYQMHGLVLVNRRREVLRPAIIWCDSRAVETGEKACRSMGRNRCFSQLLNLPGNFTASKLKWVMDNEPKIFKKVHNMLLPGDYIAMKMTGELKTTASGLSEAIMWDFRKREISSFVLEHFGFRRKLVPEIAPAFSVQGELTAESAGELGLARGTVVSYRAGDQPNNAFSLNVLEPGEIAATAGTSGVVYGVTSRKVYDRQSRVNVFAHVNDAEGRQRNGILLCVNGTGILYRWLNRSFFKGSDYNRMNCLAREVPAGSCGVMVLPYGNGAERTLQNRETGAMIGRIRFNIHDERHILRAAQEGIVFAMKSGLDIIGKMGIGSKTVRACESGMFLSSLFSEAFVNTTGTKLELYSTDGAQGAARGAGIGAGIFGTFKEAFKNLEIKEAIEPEKHLMSQYEDAYGKWLELLDSAAGD